MKARYLPVVLWSLLYISVAFLAQGTIAIYGLAFANIAELAKYEASMGHVRVNWVVCGVCFLLYFSLLLLFLCGVTIQKYKAHSTKRLEDWIAVLVGVVTMASIVNGLSVWSYGLVSIGNLHHFMMRDKPCCFAGRTPALDIHNQYMQQQSSSLSCVCIDFSECFPENPSSECSTQIENRVATYCYMLQFMQYATSGFVVVEILLLLYSLVLVCKANKEHPINREKFRTYDEYKMIRESLRREKKEMKEMRRSGGGRVSSQMSHMSQMSTDMMGEDESEIMQREGVEETNYDENAANEFDRQLWSKDGTQYGINGDIYEESLDGSEDDNVPSILPNISPKIAFRNSYSKARWSSYSDQGMVGASFKPSRQHTTTIVAQHPTETQARYTADLSASGGSVELRNYLLNAPSLLGSEHTPDNFARSLGAGSVSRSSQAPPAGRSFPRGLPLRPQARSQSLQPTMSSAGIEGERGLLSLNMASDSNSQSASASRKSFGSSQRKSIVDMVRESEKLPRLSLAAIPKQLNANVCVKCAAHHKNHCHGQPNDIHKATKKDITKTRDYKETKRREIESARKAVGGKMR